MVMKFYDGLNQEIAKKYFFSGRIKKINVIKNLGEKINFNIELIDVVVPRFLLDDKNQVKSYSSLDELEKDYFLITNQLLDKTNVVERKLGE